MKYQVESCCACAVYIYLFLLRNTCKENPNHNRPFRVPKPSLLKRGQVQNLCCENEFFLYDNEKSFSQEGFRFGLVLKQRLAASQKWRPIEKPHSMLFSFFLKKTKRKSFRCSLPASVIFQHMVILLQLQSFNLLGVICLLNCAEDLYYPAK